MKKFIHLIVLFLTIQNLNSQSSTISGIVTGNDNAPIIGANVFIEESYDGTVTEIDGSFQFTSDLQGVQNLQISYLGYETKNIKADVSTFRNLDIKLRESAATLDAVEISASTFKAGDNSKLAVLKPIDMVTTAGSMGDVIAAIQTLPGTQSNADDGRLFVRGGDANETKIYIDGLRVFSPYTRSVQGTPSRGRYSPFLFQGTSFSTGGYNTEFGQALSGVLDMKTIDNPNQTESNISLMTVGMALGHTQKGKKQSISFSGSYIDLTPYYLLAPSRLDFITPFKVFSGEMVHRYNLEDGIIKTYVAGDLSKVKLNQQNLSTSQEEEVGLNNNNVYANSSLSKILNDKTSIKAGVSFGYNEDHLQLDSFNVDQNLIGLHVKSAFKTVLSDFHILNYGVEFIRQEDRTALSVSNEPGTLSDKIDRNQYAAFASTDYFLNKNLAFKLGARAEYNSLLSTFEIDPRFTLAYKLGKNSQLSAAYGQYHQEIGTPYLMSTTRVENEKSTHYLLNYNFKNKKTILRLESYYKQYDDLVTYDFINNQYEQVSNDGYGTAYGLDLFFRTDNHIKNVDMWVSYSWLQNQRKYQDYLDTATPSYSTDHNFSLVTKTWMPKLKSQLGVTYSLTSGRPYDDKNSNEFMTGRSKMYNSISLSWAYLISQQKIFFVSVSNATRFKNNYGYRFADTPNDQGVYNSELIRPNDDQFFFAGFFITMSKDKMKNQLDSL